MAGDWLYRGSGQAKKEDEERKLRRASASEFFIKVGDQRDVLFLEDVCDGVGEGATPAIYRHKLIVDNGWPPTSVTCSLDVDQDCGVCRRSWRSADGKDLKFKRELYWFVSILDLTPWRRDDRVFNASRRILAMKRNLFERLLGKSAKRKETGYKDGLKMWAVNIRRVSEKRGNQEVSWNTGNEFEPIAHVDKPFQEMPFIRVRDGGKDLGPHPGCIGNDGKPLSLEPENWREYLKPMDKDALSALFRDHVVVDGAGSFKQRSGGGGGAPQGAAEAVSTETPDY